MQSQTPRLIPWIVTLVLCLPFPVAADITTGLSLYWAIDEGTGTQLFPGGGTADSGFLQGDPAWEPAGACVVSLCITLDGVNQWIWSNGEPMSTFLTETTGTISLWARPAGAGVAGPADIFELPGLVTENAYQLGIYQGNPDGAGDAFWFVHNGTPIAVPYTPATWVHLAWVHGGGTLSAYKNGALVSSVASGNVGVEGEFTVGRNYIGPVYWAGRVDEIKVWNRALSSSDIAEEFARGGGAGPSLLPRRKPLIWSGVPSHEWGDGTAHLWTLMVR